MLSHNSKPRVTPDDFHSTVRVDNDMLAHGSQEAVHRLGVIVFDPVWQAFGTSFELPHELRPQLYIDRFLPRLK